MYVFVCELHINACDFKGQKRYLIPMDPKSQAIVNCPKWVLGTKCRSSIRAIHRLGH